MILNKCKSKKTTKYKSRASPPYPANDCPNMKKMGKDVFLKIGFVIVDEIHAIMAESLSECMYYTSPRYLLGLSATPTRPDGMDGLLDFYFGKDNKIIRELYHEHIVYKVETGLEFEEESSNTRDNAYKSYALIQPGNDRWILVTSAFHMPKAVGLFRAAGWNVLPYPVNYQTSGMYDIKQKVGRDNIYAFTWAIAQYAGLLCHYLKGDTKELYPKDRS